MIRFKAALFATSLLTALLAVPSPNTADDGQKPAAIDVRAILEKGLASDALPEGMVVRISACLGELNREASGKELPEQLRENWEFTSSQVRRVVIEDDDDKGPVERWESRSFDSKGLCQDLLEGESLEIQARKGTGPKVAFAGSPYQRGSRTIEVLWNGQTILQLFETNGPFLELYAETDARAFGALYDRLASQARLAFKSKAGEAK